MRRRGSRAARMAPGLALVVAAVLAAAPAAAQVDLDAPVDADGGGARVPVLLVPGWGDEADELETLFRRFLEAGWDSLAVLPLTFEDPVGSNRAHAREVAAAVERLRARTGFDRVDVVAHSMGGLAVRYYLQHSGAGEVRRVVFVATPHRGTFSALVAWGEGSEEMMPGSVFLSALEQLRSSPDGVEALTVRTPMDLHVLPQESALLPGVPDVEVCCPTHSGLLDDPQAFRAIRRFLRRGP